ncbi:MAG: nitrous oxide reductase family maturation protein NosD [Gemmatimonadales bacterium]|nr:nitrous oxide reductase family maturation protein NosD [Gemmatimonadales bacterium]
MTPQRRWHPRAVVLAAVVAAWPGTALGAQAIVVDPNGPVPTLTRALALAEPGDRIVVRSGEYREPTIVVRQRVEIVGEGQPVFDGEGDREVLRIAADSVIIRGLTIRNVGTSYLEDRAGIRIEDARGCQVLDNDLINTFFAIYLARVSDCRIAGNRVHGVLGTESGTGNAIHLYNSTDILVERNLLQGHRDGIYMEFVRGAVIRGNESRGNLRYGLHFMFSDHCEYRDNIFAENGAGVAVMYTKDVTMVGNTFERNWGSAAFGLLLKEITDSRVEDNRFVGNTVGLYGEGANRIAVTHNRFERNGWAVRLLGSSDDNVFRRNMFEGNAFDVTTNSRQTSSRFVENYWDRYAGYDLDRDGYGDVPFRPVRLFSVLVERHEPALILLRSLFVDLLDLAEHVLPMLTPELLVDQRPLLRWEG